MSVGSTSHLVIMLRPIYATDAGFSIVDPKVSICVRFSERLFAVSIVNVSGEMCKSLFLRMIQYDSEKYYDIDENLLATQGEAVNNSTWPST